MTAALVCLWVGFMLGYGLSAIMAASARADEREQELLERLRAEYLARVEREEARGILGRFND